MHALRILKLGVLAAGLFLNVRAVAQVAVLGEKIFTMAGEPLTNGVVIISQGKIEAVGLQDRLPVPAGYAVLRARVVIPGIIDAHTVVGFSGILNIPHDQEQRESSAPIQPELRAVDGYNPRDPLVDWVRSFGVTTLHAGHGPGALISGQTFIVKTITNRFEQALVRREAMVAATLGRGAATGGDKPPGTRAKAIAMLRAELIKTAEYTRKQGNADLEKRPARDLRLETLARVLTGELPLLVTVHQHQDILAVLRVAAEFKLKLVLDGVAEAQLALDEIKASGFPVLLHPTMARASGERENLSLETAMTLKRAGIPFAFQSGYEAYVPKTRVVLFEAAMAAANGLTQAEALAAITIDPARILGISDRVGSLEPGKDADIALYDGDPLEYTTHCIGVIIAGEVVIAEPR